MRKLKSTKRKSLTAAQVTKAASAYRKGAGLIALGRRFRRTPSSLARILRKRGVKIRGRGRPKGS